MPLKTYWQKRVICLQSCQHLIRTAPRVCRDSWHSQTRNLRCTGSQRTLGGNIWEKKNGFPEMITSLPCVIDQMTLKPPKQITSITRDKSMQAARSQQYSVLSWSPLVLPEWDCPRGHLPHLETHWTSTHILVWLPALSYLLCWPLSISSALSRLRQRGWHGTEANLKMEKGIAPFNGYLRKQRKHLHCYIFWWCVF